MAAGFTHLATLHSLMNVTYDVTEAKHCKVFSVLQTDNTQQLTTQYTANAALSIKSSTVKHCQNHKHS